MSIPHEATTAVVKAANTATYAGSASAVYFGLSPGEWQVIGIIGGLLTAVAGFCLSWWYKHQHLQIARRSRDSDD